VLIDGYDLSCINYKRALIAGAADAAGIGLLKLFSKARRLYKFTKAAEEAAELASESGPKLLEGLSKKSLKHINKHLKEFQKLNSKIDLNDVVNLGHKISTNSKNLIGTPGGRQVFEEVVNLGGKSTRVRAVLNTAGKLRSVNIRY
jgi:hypothetical protein